MIIYDQPIDGFESITNDGSRITHPITYHLSQTARQLREDLRVLTGAEIERLVRDFWRPEVIRKTWDYYVAKGRAAGILDR